MEEEDYVFESKDDYCDYNHKIIQKEREKHESEKEDIYYDVHVEYFRPYRMYFLIIPKSYLDNVEYLRKNKNDIFAKGKILTFSSESHYKRHFKFDAVIDSQEEDPYKKGVVYVNLVPIKVRYRYKFARELLGNFIVKERNGDLTYDRMDEALDDFDNEKCCSKNIEHYILGHEIKRKKNMNNIFNFARYFPSNIFGFFRLYPFQRNKINKILNQEMTTVLLKSNTPMKILSLIINAIYQKRLYKEDKILICSSSNTSADNISLQLLELKNYVKKLNILRIYAKNQEIIKRHESLNNITYHKLVLKEENRGNFLGGRNWLIEKNDIIISTCVNSYCDEIINYDFPFVIIVDADNSNENENLIPITLHAKHVVLIAYEESESDYDNLYKRMKTLYPENHINL